MKNELFHLGPLTIYGYGTMIALGILAACLMISLRAKKEGADEDMAFHLVIVSLTGGFLAAKLTYWIINWQEIAADPYFIVDTIQDGFVVMGGLAGGIAACLAACRRRNLSFGRYFDLFMPCVALGQGFGRLGCLLAGCCYGKTAAHRPWIIFQDSPFAPDGIPLVPVQAYSSLLDFANCAFLLLYGTWLKSRGRYVDGKVGCMYLMLYSTGRFFLEFLRGDIERGFVSVLSTSQLLSLLAGGAGAAAYAVLTSAKTK